MTKRVETKLKVSPQKEMTMGVVKIPVGVVAKGEARGSCVISNSKRYPTPRSIRLLASIVITSHTYRRY